MSWRLVLVGIAMMGIAIPLILQMVPPNPLYGFRTSYTMSSAEVWYRANRIAGFAILGAGVAWTTVAVVLPLTWRSDRALWWVIGLGVSFMTIAVMVTYVLVYRGR